MTGPLVRVQRPNDLPRQFYAFQRAAHKPGNITSPLLLLLQLEWTNQGGNLDDRNVDFSSLVTSFTLILVFLYLCVIVSSLKILFRHTDPWLAMGYPRHYSILSFIHRSLSFVILSTPICVHDT